jgi:hypothetical protein
MSETRRDPERESMLAACLDDYGVATDGEAEWPNNLVSRRAVAYESGHVRGRDEPAPGPIDRDELARCRALAREVAEMMSGVAVGMGSESGDGFHAYWLVPESGAPHASRIDEALVRRAFSNTLFPLVTVAVEPLRAEGAWWERVEQDGSESDRSYFHPWRRMLAWFASHDAFVDLAFVSIGDREALWEVESQKHLLPPGTSVTGCVLPKLAVGLTRIGSLVGLFGWTVES